MSEIMSNAHKRFKSYEEQISALCTDLARERKTNEGLRTRIAYVEDQNRRLMTLLIHHGVMDE